MRYIRTRPPERISHRLLVPEYQLGSFGSARDDNIQIDSTSSSVNLTINSKHVAPLSSLFYSIAHYLFQGILHNTRITLGETPQPSSDSALLYELSFELMANESVLSQVNYLSYELSSPPPRGPSAAIVIAPIDLLSSIAHVYERLRGREPLSSKLREALAAFAAEGTTPPSYYKLQERVHDVLIPYYRTYYRYRDSSDPRHWILSGLMSALTVSLKTKHAVVPADATTFYNEDIPTGRDKSFRWMASRLRAPRVKEPPFPELLEWASKARLVPRDVSMINLLGTDVSPLSAIAAALLRYRGYQYSLGLEAVVSLARELENVGRDIGSLPDSDDRFIVRWQWNRAAGEPDSGIIGAVRSLCAPLLLLESREYDDAVSMGSLGLQWLAGLTDLLPFPRTEEFMIPRVTIEDMEGSRALLVHLCDQGWDSTKGTYEDRRDILGYIVWSPCALDIIVNIFGGIGSRESIATYLWGLYLARYRIDDTVIDLLTRARDGDKLRLGKAVILRPYDERRGNQWKVGDSERGSIEAQFQEGGVGFCGTLVVRVRGRMGIELEVVDGLFKLGSGLVVELKRSRTQRVADLVRRGVPVIPKELESDMMRFDTGQQAVVMPPEESELWSR